MSKFAGLVGSQNASVACFSDPITWYMFCLQANHHLPKGGPPPARPRPSPCRPRGLNDKWELPEWEPIREAAKRAEFAAALIHTRRLGHFNPTSPCHNQVDFQTVGHRRHRAQSPLDRAPPTTPNRAASTPPPACTHAGGTKRGSNSCSPSRLASNTGAGSSSPPTTSPQTRQHRR